LFSSKWLAQKKTDGSTEKYGAREEKKGGRITAASREYDSGRIAGKLSQQVAGRKVHPLRTNVKKVLAVERGQGKKEGWTG